MSYKATFKMGSFKDVRMIPTLVPWYVFVFNDENINMQFPSGGRYRANFGYVSHDEKRKTAIYKLQSIELVKYEPFRPER